MKRYKSAWYNGWQVSVELKPKQNVDKMNATSINSQVENSYQGGSIPQPVVHQGGLWFIRDPTWAMPSFFYQDEEKEWPVVKAELVPMK